MRRGTETTVRQYRGPDAYAKDARKLAEQGWQPVNTIEQRPRSGCLRMLLLTPIGAIAFRPKPTLVVTYQRERPA